MTDDEMLIGIVALCVAMLSTTFAFGPWTSPYELRSIALVETRYGKPAARCAWLLIAILSGTSSVAILSGVRPSYATPATRLDRSH